MKKGKAEWDRRLNWAYEILRKLHPDADGKDKWWYEPKGGGIPKAKPPKGPGRA